MPVRRHRRTSEGATQLKGLAKLRSDKTESCGTAHLGRLECSNEERGKEGSRFAHTVLDKVELK